MRGSNKKFLIKIFSNSLPYLSKVIHIGDFVGSRASKVFIDNWFTLLGRNLIVAAIFAIWLKTNIVFFGILGVVSFCFLLVYSNSISTDFLNNLVKEMDDINQKYKKIGVSLLRTDSISLSILAISLILITSVLIQYALFLAFSFLFDLI